MAGRRVVKGVTEWLVEWKGYENTSDWASWQPEEDLEGTAGEAIAEYLAKVDKEKSAKHGGTRRGKQKVVDKGIRDIAIKGVATNIKGHAAAITADCRSSRIKQRGAI